MRLFLLLTTILTLTGCNQSVYKKSNFVEKIAVGTMDVLFFGEFSEYVACQEKHGEGSEICKEIARKAAGPYKDAISTSIEYHANKDSSWDYQPGNDQWVCRQHATGQYTEIDNCSGKPMVDNWR